MRSNQPGFELSEEQKQRIKEKNISEEEVADCIAKEMENGKDQEQAIAICLSKLESGNSEPTNTDSLENPRYGVGDFVEWEFGDGTSQGEVIDMKNEVGNSMSAGGNTFTIEEGDGPLYKMEEWDETEGEDGEFTNNVVKFEDSLGSTDRPAAAERSQELNMQERVNMAQEKQGEMKRVAVNGKDIQVVKQEDELTQLQVPIQATSEDRDGDIITSEGQQQIVDQLKTGTVPLFPNHGVGEGEAMYDFRDIFGKFTDGIQMEDGKTVGTITLRKGRTETGAEELHPMAKELVNLLEQDMPVGFSVGFIPHDSSERENGEGQKISDLDLMEVSSVGIPSNPEGMPAAMSEAASQTTAIAAKQMIEAGFNKHEVVQNVKTALNNTMTESNKNNDDGQEQNNDSKSEFKQLDEGQVEQVTNVVGDAINQHMTAALEDIQENLLEAQEEDEADEDGMEEEGEHDNDEDEEEMNQNTGGSDQSEDPKKQGSSESEKSEGLSEDQKTVDSEDPGRKMNTIDNKDSKDSKNENQEETGSDPFKVRQTR